MFARDEIAGLASGAMPEILLGDLVLARQTCMREAEERGVALAAHVMHLIVHGTLHLLGHDHVDAREAEAMEMLERAVMKNLGLHDPYQPLED